MGFIAPGLCLAPKGSLPGISTLTEKWTRNAKSPVQFPRETLRKDENCGGFLMMVRILEGLTDQALSW